MSEFKYYIVEWIIRTFLGILFLAQGYDKVFKVKLSGVVEAFETEMSSKRIPRFILVLAAYFTSFAELIGGLLLIVGYCKFYALSVLGVDMLLVAAAFSIMEPMWDMEFVFPRFAILVTLFILPEEWGRISLDYLLNN